LSTSFVVTATSPTGDWACIVDDRVRAEELAGLLRARGFSASATPAAGMVKAGADLGAVAAAAVAASASTPVAAPHSPTASALFDRSALPAHLAGLLDALDRDGWTWGTLEEVFENGWGPGFKCGDYVFSENFTSSTIAEATSWSPGLGEELSVVFVATSGVVAAEGETWRTHAELTCAIAHGDTPEGLLAKFLAVDPSTLEWAALPAERLSDLRLLAYDELKKGTPGVREVLESYATWAEDADELTRLAAGASAPPAVPPVATSLELWLSTHMWNEGFEQADHAKGSAVLVEPSDVAAYRAWVGKNLAGMGRDWGRLFHVQDRRTGGTLPTTLAGAVKVAELADSLWDGI
jgi:hypothetical protein